MVTLTATADAGSEFVKWTGCETETVLHECEVTMTEVKTVKAEFNKSAVTEFPLKVEKTGSGTGTVTSSPPGIDCGGTCEASFSEGEVVTLTAAADPGSEFVRWTGCTSAVGDECEVMMSEAKTVKAEFNTESGGSRGPTGPEGPVGPTGVRGPTGPTGSQGPVGPTGSQGPVGPTGSQGPVGTTGSPGGEGKEGKAGTNGTNGSNGERGGQGPAGLTGSVGPVGPQGPAGPAGQVELVTCKTVKKGKKSVQQCTTKLVSGTVKFTAAGASAQATLSRHGAVYAAGTARSAYGRMSLRLTALRRLRPGRYRLTLITGSGRDEHIRSESFTLR